MTAYIVEAARVSPRHEIDVRWYPRYIVRMQDMPALPPLNEAILAFTVSSVDAEGTRTPVNDAVLRGSAVLRDPTAVLAGATNATPIVVTTGMAHGLTTGDWVVLDHVLGNYAANGRHQVTVVDPTSFSLDGSVGDGEWISGGVVKSSPAGVHDLQFTYVAASDGLYEVTVGADVPLDTAQRYEVYVWDASGPHAGKFLRSFNLPSR